MHQRTQDLDIACKFKVCFEYILKFSRMALIHIPKFSFTTGLEIKLGAPPNYVPILAACISEYEIISCYGSRIGPCSGRISQRLRGQLFQQL